MKEKCAVEVYNNKLVVGTWIIHQGFERRHAEILKLCRKYEAEFMELADNPKVVSSHPSGVSNTRWVQRKIKNEKGGAPIKEYLLNKAQTIFLGTMFRAKKGNDPVLRFKVKLAKDFIKQEKLIMNLAIQRQNPKWIENRALGKITRREETDTIKDFVTYATLQGSKNAKKYYMILSKCVNDNLFTFAEHFKNKREVMTVHQLVAVEFGDKIVSRGLIEGMNKSLPYKEIYQNVKSRLITMAELCGKTEIIEKLQAIT